MRRLSFIRPKEKLRGVKRRLRSLDRWASSFNGYFPSEYSEDKYWNVKIPVLDRLVNQPATNSWIQSQCVTSLIKAASFISEAKPKELESAVVTVLVAYPDMFSSEICVFFQRDYFISFFERNSQFEKLYPLKEESLIQNLGLCLPEKFKEFGFLYEYNEIEDGVDYSYKEQWWSLREGKCG